MVRRVRHDQDGRHEDQHRDRCQAQRPRDLQARARKQLDVLGGGIHRYRAPLAGIVAEAISGATYSSAA
jgi:hypothetical protein